MGQDYDSLHDLMPGRDRFPASYIPIIREGLNHEISGAGVMHDAMGTAIVMPQTATLARWGKLDGTLSAGGTATVSLWQKTGGGWGGWDEDSGEDWEDCYAPPMLTSGSLDAGTFVLVEVINGRRVVTMAEC